MSDAPPFVGLARVETMLKDFARLRKAIRTDHDIEAAERVLDKCERWFACIAPNPKTTSLQEEVERLEIENWQLKKALDLFDKTHRAALAKEDT